MAGDRIQQIQNEIKDSLIGDFDPESEEVKEVITVYQQLYQKIRYDWRSEDKNALSQLRAAADKVLGYTFRDVVRILDNFYETFRVPELNSAGLPILDDKKRWVWKKNELGQYIEDFSQVNGQDIEKALFDLQRTKVEISQATSQLYLEAVFAHYVMKDEYHDKYESLLEGTVGDRTARANRETKESKYFSFFRYYLWQRASTFEKEITELMRLLERIRQWRIMEQKE